MNIVIDFNRGNFEEVITNDLDSYFVNIDVEITVQDENKKLYMGSNFHQIFLRDLFFRLEILYSDRTPFYIDTWGNGDFYYFNIYDDVIIIEKNNQSKFMFNSMQFRKKLSEAMDNILSKLQHLNPNVVKHSGYISLKGYTMSIL